MFSDRSSKYLAKCDIAPFSTSLCPPQVADNVNRIYQAQEVLCGGDPEVTWKHTDATEILSAYPDERMQGSVSFTAFITGWLLAKPTFELY